MTLNRSLCKRKGSNEFEGSNSVITKIKLSYYAIFFRYHHFKIIPVICPMAIQKKSWLKRIGWIGFFFFLIKGLLWLGAFYFGFKFLD